MQIKVNHLKLTGLLDSGSAITILGNNLHTKLCKHGFTLQRNHTIHGTVANGQSITSIDIIKLPVLFRKSFAIITAHVIPIITEPFILGIDFWKEFNLAPDILSNITLHKNSDKPSFLLNTNVSHLLDYNNLSETQRITADAIIQNFKNISTENIPLGKTHLIEHQIDTGDHTPIRQRCYRLSPEKQKALRVEVEPHARIRCH